MYNSSREVTTTTTFHYETTTNEDGTTSKRLVSSTNVVTQESYTPTIMVSTAKTWIFSREAGFKQTNLGPTYSHSDTGSGENRVIIDIESSGASYSEETPKEEYNGGEKGEEGTATDSEGNYLVADDGVGIPTVGFGIALKYNVDRFAAKGVTGVQNWQIGDNCYKDYGVSNSIIDEIMLEEIADWKESVRKDTAACVPPLNEQQIDALETLIY